MLRQWAYLLIALAAWHGPLERSFATSNEEHEERIAKVRQLFACTRLLKERMATATPSQQENWQRVIAHFTLVASREAAAAAADNEAPEDQFIAQLTEQGETEFDLLQEQLRELPTDTLRSARLAAFIGFCNVAAGIKPTSFR